MRVLILGGGGAVGSAIARRGVARGFEVHVVVRETTVPVRPASPSADSIHRCDVSDTERLASLVDRLRPNLIVQAAFPPGHPRSDLERRTHLLAMCGNILGVLPALRNAEFDGRLVWLGSAMSYGEGEGPRRPRDPLRPKTFRGAMKASESWLAAQMALEFGLRLSELRIFTGYGPYQQRERLLPQLLKAALTGGRLRMTTQPFYRDWVHYDDISDACFAAALSPTHSRVFNVCSGRLVSTHQVAAIVEGLAGRDLRASEPFHSVDEYPHVEAGVLPTPDEGLDWQPHITLEDGLTECWQWAHSREGRNYLLTGGTDLG